MYIVLGTQFDHNIIVQYQLTLSTYLCRCALCPAVCCVASSVSEMMMCCVESDGGIFCGGGFNSGIISHHLHRHHCLDTTVSHQDNTSRTSCTYPVFYFDHIRISQNDATKRFRQQGREKETRHPLVCQDINDGGCVFVGGEDRVGIRRKGSHAVSDPSGFIFTSSIHEADEGNDAVLDGGGCIAS